MGPAFNLGPDRCGGFVYYTLFCLGRPNNPEVNTIRLYCL